MDALGLPFALGCLALWMVVMVVIARPGPLFRRRRERAKVPPSSVYDELAARRQRAERAEFRHAIRYGRRP